MRRAPSTMDTRFSLSREAVLEAMESTGREAMMRELWGSGFDLLVDYLALACAPTHVGMRILQESIARRPVCKTMVLSGERCSGADIEHGTDSPILLGLASVMELLAPVSCIRSEERTGRESNALSLVLSGGVTLMPQMGELPCDIMIEQFDTMTAGRFKDVIGADAFALNTGDQGRVLAAILFARRIERVVFCHVVDHIARFAATVTVALKQLIDAENDRLEDLIVRYSGDEHEALRVRIRAARPTMPEVLFVALGTWGDRDPRRGRDDGLGISRAREAFGPKQTEQEAMYPGKLLGCEYADRYFAEQDPVKSIGYACPAMSPIGMIRLIPSWVKDRSR